MNRTSGMKQRTLVLLIMSAVVLLAGTSVVKAQASGSNDAVTNILAQVAVVGEQDLTFADIVPGDTGMVAVATADAAVGIWRITGAATQPLTVALLLPTYLEEVGGDKLIVEFAATDAAHVNTGGAVLPTDGGHTIYDPNSVLEQATGAAGDLDIFLGGKIRARNAQTAGAYSGTIILTCWYAGN